MKERIKKSIARKCCSLYCRLRPAFKQRSITTVLGLQMLWAESEDGTEVVFYDYYGFRDKQK